MRRELERVTVTRPGAIFGADWVPPRTIVRSLNSLRSVGVILDGSIIGLGRLAGWPPWIKLAHCGGKPVNFPEKSTVKLHCKR